MGLPACRGATSPGRRPWIALPGPPLARSRPRPHPTEGPGTHGLASSCNERAALVACAVRRDDLGREGPVAALRQARAAARTPGVAARQGVMHQCST